MASSGMVYIVGAGPGGLDSLTCRARELLQQAEAVVYDALVDHRLLDLLSPRCETFAMGKRGGQPSLCQADINQLLVDLCQQNRRVVRLKSGDPFIFGRVGSELQALQQANCYFEVVPGLSTALAAPLLAGIPLTDPVWSHGFAVVSAHDPDLLDWEGLARIPTLVVLMGAQHLDDIGRRLHTHGCRGDLPVAIIRWAAQAHQQIWEGSLLSIGRVVKGEELAPCVMVFGEVVKLRHYLRATATAAIAATLPLAGKTVLITRSQDQASPFAQLLQAQGARVLELPALEIGPPSDWQPLDQAIAGLEHFHWLILTSANGVTSFLDRLLSQGKDLRALASLKIAVVGRKTAAVLKQRGLQADFIPPDFIADALIDRFPPPLIGQQLLFPRVESGGRDLLVQGLAARGARVIEVAAYESRCPAGIDRVALAALENHQVDVVTFASSKTVTHTSQMLAQAVGPDWLELFRGVAIAAIGPQTAATCRQVLGRVDLEPLEYTLDALTGAIVAWANASLG
ncbi:MAG: uroporphyrinogen-III C-methyltransferase [Cyanobacteria bacterium REEB459]|nr:uroporphyrinogen-III C-methyltransferase [Cyanobacteria bacterium REEB459]